MFDGLICVIHHLGEPEIRNFDFGVMDQDILGLHIPVYNLVLLHNFESIHDLPENQQTLLFRQLPVLFLYILVKTPPVTEFKEDIQIVRSLSDIVHFDDMVMV